MSRKKAIAAAKVLRDRFESGNYTQESIDSMMLIIGRCLASLRGGDAFEDMGYEPLEDFGWDEFSVVLDVLAAVDGTRDIEDVAEIIFEVEDEEDEDEED